MSGFRSRLLALGGQRFETLARHLGQEIVPHQRAKRQQDNDKR